LTPDRSVDTFKLDRPDEREKSRGVISGGAMSFKQSSEPRDPMARGHICSAIVRKCLAMSGSTDATKDAKSYRIGTSFDIQPTHEAYIAFNLFRATATLWSIPERTQGDIKIAAFASNII
jgi:hypothetical protein